MKFSVIVPVYNVAPYLRACLDSVVRQTFADFECVCVDDGSTDGSGRILDAYAAEDPRFRVIHQPNGGEGAARNSGLDAATGDWICFLDADDVLNERTLEIYDLGIRTEPSADLVTVGMTCFGDGCSPVWSDGDDVRWMSFDCRRRVSEEVYRPNLWTGAYRRAPIEGLRFGGLTIGADRVFFSQVVERIDRVVLTEWVCYGYRQRIGSAYRSRLTAAPLLDELRHYESLFRTVRDSEKEYDPAIARSWGEGLLEGFAAVYFRLQPDERDRVWDEWLEAMRFVSTRAGVRPYMRAVMRIVVRTRSRLLARVLIDWVYWLKLHGVNRRLAVHRRADG